MSYVLELIYNLFAVDTKVLLHDSLIDDVTATMFYKSRHWTSSYNLTLHQPERNNMVKPMTNASRHDKLTDNMVLNAVAKLVATLPSCYLLLKRVWIRPFPLPVLVRHHHTVPIRWLTGPTGKLYRDTCSYSYNAVDRVKNCQWASKLDVRSQYQTLLQ